MLDYFRKNRRIMNLNRDGTIVGPSALVVEQGERVFILTESPWCQL